MGDTYILRKGHSTLGDLKNGMLAMLGITGDVHFVDPVNGSDGNNGSDASAPMKTVTAAYNLCADAHNDAVVMLPATGGDTLAAAITWSKNFTHLIGLSNDLPGMGQRCRVLGGATTDLTKLVTFSGYGCIVRNIQFYNGADADVDNGAVIVSGNRNYFKNCLFVGMNHATPAARAGSYSLKVTGSEDYFEDCTIGYDSIERGAGEPPELWLATGCSKAVFNHCRILTRSETITASPVKIDAEPLGYVEFDNCIFVNTSTNWAVALTDCFTITSAQTHYVGMRGLNQLVGITGWADTATRMYMAMPASANTGGTNTAPTT